MGKFQVLRMLKSSDFLLVPTFILVGLNEVKPASKLPISVGQLPNFTGFFNQIP